MSTQLDLLAPLSRRTDPPTSRAGAAMPGKETQRQRALRALRQAGERGLTDYELSVVTGIARHVVARRRKDLVTLGHVAETTRTRLTDSGCPAVVWRAL